MTSNGAGPGVAQVAPGVSIYTLQVVGERPLTINRVASMHRQAWANHTRRARADWAKVAAAFQVPRLDVCIIVATPLHANHASPQDIAACAPEVKAAIDGLRDAGVLDDDTADIVQRITFEAPRVCGDNGLELTITAAAA